MYLNTATTMTNQVQNS